MPVSTISVACNHCGAPLEVSDNTRFVTCAHCKSQLQVQHTDSSHFTEVLSKIEVHSERAATELEIIRLQNELESADRDWEKAKEPFLTRLPNGGTVSPKGMLDAYAFMAVCVVAAIIWMVVAISLYYPLILLTVLPLGLGIMNMRWSAYRIRQYDSIHQRYWDRRKRILKQIKAAKDTL